MLFRYFQEPVYFESVVRKEVYIFGKIYHRTNCYDSRNLEHKQKKKKKKFGDLELSQFKDSKFLRPYCIIYTLTTLKTVWNNRKVNSRIIR